MVVDEEFWDLKSVMQPNLVAPELMSYSIKQFKVQCMQQSNVN